jgi:hypothetical protein
MPAASGPASDFRIGRAANRGLRPSVAWAGPPCTSPGVSRFAPCVVVTVPTVPAAPRLATASEAPALTGCGSRVQPNSYLTRISTTAKPLATPGGRRRGCQ